MNTTLTLSNGSKITIFLSLSLFLLFGLISCGGGGGGGGDSTPPKTAASPASGLYGEAQAVTLTANETATIYYTLDGTTPAIGGENTTSGPSPVTGIQISNDSTLLQFFAVDSSGNREAVKSQTYVISTGDATGPGDVQNYFPVTQGNTWNYEVTATETGFPTTTSSESISIAGTKQFNGVTAVVLKTAVTGAEEYLYKNSRAVTYLGNTDPADPITNQLVPYQAMLFTMQPGSSFVQANKAGVVYGEDLDGDMRNETADVKSIVTLKNLESVTVPVGTFSDSAKIETNLTLTVTLSSNKAKITVTAVQTQWFAPGVGPVKSITVTTGDGFSETDTEELTGYIVDGHGQGIRIELTPSSGLIKTGDTLQFTANAFDGINNPVSGIEISWNSSNPAAASIDSNGMAEGISPGATTITASAGDVVSNSETVTVLLAATFGPPGSLVVGGQPTFAAVRDLNDDGKLDLAVANSGSNTVSILLGTGTGSFGAATNFAVGSVPVFVSIGDFNGDAKPDLAVVNYETISDHQIFPGSVSILLGTGTGSFGAATNFPAQGWATSVAIADFNGDGNQDLAVANLGFGNLPSSVSILLGTGTGSFGEATNVPVGESATFVASGDFNGDGKPDLTVANSHATAQAGSVDILLGTGTGSFGPAASFAVGFDPRSVAIGDFNGDGKQDLVVANSGSSTVSILLGDGAGSFGPASNFFTAFGNPGYCLL